MAEAMEEVSIVALDAHGHGVASNGVIVPGALPGERTLVRPEGKRAELVETLTPPERAAPICRWFGTVRRLRRAAMSPSLYREWKRGLVVDALEREGVSAKVEELVDAHGAGGAAPRSMRDFPMASRTKLASCARTRMTLSRSTSAPCSVPEWPAQ